MPLSIPNVLEVQETSGPNLPVVFDSPHSGNIYPSDFAFIAPRDAMTGSEDRFVDELYAVAPEYGAALLRALFPRAYIDPNRSLADLDVNLLDGPWPDKVQASEKVGIGLGLICKYAEADVPIYGRKLSVAEVKRRIEHYYLPYHRALAELLDARHARFGQVWHLNCHSMWPQGTALSTDPGSPRHAHIRKTLDRLNAPCLDLNEVFAADSEWPRYFFPRDGHWSPAGHARAAEAIAAFIERETAAPAGR